jgi:hypothetical protein
MSICVEAILKMRYLNLGREGVNKHNHLLGL